MSIDTLPSADKLAEKARTPFPGETDEYRNARQSLLKEEIEFRRQMTRLAERRRALPDGPIIEKDYRFKDANGADLGLLELFDGKQALVTYFWMFGPARSRPCPMCTNWLGAVNGNAADIKQRVSLKILGRSPVERQIAFAQERGWRDLDFVQTAGDDYASDLGLINADGSENPALCVFKRDGDRVRLFWASEVSADMADPGQDPRDAPDIASLWSILDLTPGGRGGSCRAWLGCWRAERNSGSAPHGTANGLLGLGALINVCATLPPTTSPSNIPSPPTPGGGYRYCLPT